MMMLPKADRAEIEAVLENKPCRAGPSQAYPLVTNDGQKVPWCIAGYAFR